MFVATSKELPKTLVYRLRDFLLNDSTRFQVNGKRGNPLSPRQRPLQGAAQCPLLFEPYIANLCIRSTGDGEGGTTYRQRLRDRQSPKQANRREGLQGQPNDVTE